MEGSRPQENAYSFFLFKEMLKQMFFFFFKGKLKPLEKTAISERRSDHKALPGSAVNCFTAVTTILNISSF